ncbi:MAG: hypothetical protein G01um10148_809 [Parcubacteria group bacterium Gr01-1014_8]|nr:MAG: hypothetical protein G01um10148_809 [Parcubacteria group bacterium Gr01-1014_8]
MPSSPKVTPKDFFLWAGAMVALYGGVISFVTLLFQYIDYAYPDPLSNYSYSDPFSGSMRFAMATLIVLVPVALVIMRFIRKDIARIPEKNELWVRRWALVLTVFIAGAAVVGDSIALINSFLGGDLTTPFLLKVVALLLVAGAAFLHFLADLRGYWTANRGRAQMVGYGAGTVVLLTVVAGFFIMGTPGDVRLMRYDSQKVTDLQNIQWQVVNYWQQKQMLPTALSQLEDPISGWKAPLDPEDKREYTYEKTGDMSFKLCAEFNFEVTEEMNGVKVAYPEYGVSTDNWLHGQGEHCFDRTIDPDLYPVYPKGVPIRE